MTYRRVSLFISQFILFIMLKIRDRACLKIEKRWFLLAHWLSKSPKGITTYSNNFLRVNIVNDYFCCIIFIPRENSNSKKTQFLCSNSCFSATRETKSLYITLIIFFSSLNIKNYSKHTHCVKCVQIRSFFWSVFSRIQSEWGKTRPRKNSVLGHFSSSDSQYYSEVNSEPSQTSKIDYFPKNS